MTDKEIQEIALFRFSLIAPVVNETYEAVSKMQYFRDIASRPHKLPNGIDATYSPDTIKQWYLSYKKHGIDGLLLKKRSDAGRPRAFDNETIEKIHAIKEKYPYITGKMVYHKLVEEGYIKASQVSLASIYRYIRNHNLKRDQLMPIERRAYEMEYANDCWQSDTSFGPKIIINGKKKQTYLIAFIDDASRLMVHAEFFTRDTAINMQIAFKKAVKKYGLPKRLFVDNGKSYKNNQLNLICASLGITLIHTRAYSPQSKGKIERSFRTFKDNYINSSDWNTFESLEHLNKEFSQYLNKDYQNKKHTTIGEAPRIRYLKDIDRIKYKLEEEIENSFLHRVMRKVNSDATIKLNSNYFEVPQKYIGQRLNIRYSPIELEEAYIFNEEYQKIETIYPLRRIDNSKVKRNTINYAKIIEGEEENV